MVGNENSGRQSTPKSGRKPIYKPYDMIQDIDYYWISANCSNCKDHSQIGIKKGVKFNSSRLKLMKCPRCEIIGTLYQVVWNGKTYVRPN